MGMVRTQLQLDPRDHAALKQYAHRRGLSMAAAIRQILRASLDPQGNPTEQQVKAFLRAAGSGRDKGGRSDVARHHDLYLYDGEPE